MAPSPASLEACAGLVGAKGLRFFFQSWKNSLTCCETLDKPLPSGVGAEKELNGLISVNPAHMMVLARLGEVTWVHVGRGQPFTEHGRREANGSVWLLS